MRLLFSTRNIFISEDMSFPTRCFNMFIWIFKGHSGIYFSIWLLERKCLHLNSGEINWEYCRKQFWVPGVERKGLPWCSGSGIGHRSVGEYTTSVQHTCYLDFYYRSDDWKCFVKWVLDVHYSYIVVYLLFIWISTNTKIISVPFIPCFIFIQLHTPVCCLRILLHFEQHLCWLYVCPQCLSALVH